MTEVTSDLGLDLVAIQEAHGTHSIFAPSGSAIWLNTPGCLIPNILAPDSAGIEAAYGTVGHECGEQWLRAIPKICWGMGELAQAQIDAAEPRHRLGEIVEVEEKHETFEIEIDQEMLDYVRTYVEWVMRLPGEHYIETRVDFSDLTPIPNQGGTADHAACQPGILTVSDLKMGYIRVLAKLNTQLRIYAYGFFRKYDHVYNFQKIVIRIAQPRLGHFDTWECSREDLLAFAEEVRAKAHEAWQLDRPRRPGGWCKKAFCNVQATCGAYLCWLADQADADGDLFDDQTEHPEDFCQICEGLGCDACAPVEFHDDGSIKGVYTVKDMATTAEAFVSGKIDLTPRRSPGQLNTEALAKLLPMRPVIERFFNEIERELESRAIDGEDVPGYKLVEGRQGKRVWVDTKLALTGLTEATSHADMDLFELAPATLGSPAQVTEIIRRALGITKKAAEDIVESWVTRSPARQTLAEEADQRPKLSHSTFDVFDDVSGDGL